MNANIIFTKKVSGFDKRIWFVMAVSVAISLLLMGYVSYNRTDDIPCKPVSIAINGITKFDHAVFNTGEFLLFRAPISPGDRITWDFGDNTKIEEGFTATHTYNQQNIYRIVVTVNGKCRSELIVNVKPPITITDNDNLLEGIMGRDTTNMGVDENFSTILEAGSYEWSIENDNNYVTRYGKETVFRFRTPGRFTVVLMLDNDLSKKYRKQVYVKERVNIDRGEGPIRSLINDDYTIVKQRPEDKPPPQVNNVPPPVANNPVASERTIIKIENLQFKEYLQSLVCGEMNSSDFDKFLHDGGKTKTFINNKDSKTFEELCNVIKGKKIKIENVDLVKDNGRIINIKVMYDQKSRFGKNPCNN